MVTGDHDPYRAPMFVLPMITWVCRLRRQIVRRQGRPRVMVRVWTPGIGDTDPA